MKMRRFMDRDAGEATELVRRNFMEINIRDYPVEEMKRLSNLYDEEKILKIASEAHMYVACDSEKIVGTGAISSFWGSETESILQTVFVLPEYQKQGVGRSIMEVLEKDEYFLRATRIEVLASITACEFYRKLGYVYKNGVKQLDDKKLFHMEKVRPIESFYFHLRKSLV